MDKRDNLISLADRTPEERKAIASKGGKARGEQRRQRKLIRECLQEIQTMPMPKDKCAELGLPDDSEYQVGIAMSLIRGTLEGNPQMARTLLTCIGEMKQDFNISTISPPIIIHDDVPPEDYPTNAGVVLIDNVKE